MNNFQDTTEDHTFQSSDPRASDATNPMSAAPADRIQVVKGRLVLVLPSSGGNGVEMSPCCLCACDQCCDPDPTLCFTGVTTDMQ